MIVRELVEEERGRLTALLLALSRLARGAGLSARSEGGEIEGSLMLAQVRPDELVENASHEFIGSVTYAGALYSRTLAELFERALSAPAALTASLRE